MNKTKPDSAKPTDDHSNHAVRETIESVVVAVILAFLLRSFLVEPFVIPTGSMAPTLMGRHKDVTCEKCGHEYLTGASSENDDARDLRTVIATVCPVCRYRMVLNPSENANQATFNGDRIVVSKFAYDLNDPKRWDVIVFKFPGNAKQNYIKRLVGLPNEVVRIFHGDIFVQPGGQGEFQIARKPEDKLLAMLQLVDDSRNVADELVDAGWPNRWQPWSPTDSTSADDSATEALDGGRRFAIDASGKQDVWLRYHHVPPSLNDWRMIEAGQTPQPLNEGRGQLITDFYAYNAFISIPRGESNEYDPSIPPEEFSNRVKLGVDAPLSDAPNSEAWGMHWVGDLALEGEIDIKSDEGHLLLNLVEAGVNHTVRINVADGTVEMTRNNGAGEFDSAADSGDEATVRKGNTSIRGAGSYTVRFANVDDQLWLWVDGSLVEFDGPTTFVADQDQNPKWSPQDPGDLAPAGIGASGLSVELNRLRIWRDLYYLAISDQPGYATGRSDYDLFRSNGQILEIFASPENWASTDLFESRRAIEFVMEDRQYFPLGDNSPQSSDARLWRAPPYVERDMLLGKAVMIYWPHGWNRPVPFTPNVRRMGVIR